jgi:hypothetical protein
MAVSVELPGMFDLQAAKEQQRHNTGYEAAQIPVGRVPIYASSVGGDIYNEGLMGLAGMLGGAPDPEVAKQQKVAEIMERFPNPETSEDMMKVYHALNAAGIYDFAGQIFNMATALRNQETNLLNAQKASSSTDPNIAAQRLLEIDAAKWLTVDSNKPGYEHNLENWKRQLLELRKAGFFDTDTYKQLQKNIDDEEKNLQAAEKSINNDVIKMGTRWVKDANITETEAALTRMEQLLAKYPGKTDIPGIDMWEQFVGGKIFGSILNFPGGQEALEVMQALGAIKNALLKERSGAAVTESELKRFTVEVSGAFPNDSAVRRFIAELRIALDKEKAHIAGGFRPEVRNRYWMQSGYYPTYATPEDVPADLPSGSYYFSPDGKLRRKA